MAVKYFNIILDPIFIFGLHWGMKGAEIATIIGQLVSLIVAAALTVSFMRSIKRSTKKLK